MKGRLGVQWQRSLLLLGIGTVFAAAQGPVCAQAGSAPESAEPAEAARQRESAGGLRFNFAGEEWLDVLQWFADEAELNLDWQELPDDKLNLTTQREYTVTEALDVLNLHLLPRGFTLLRRGDVLFLVQLGEDLNPALVPRVDPDDLDQRGRYEFCKVSFPLDWMLAKTAVEELEPMLSRFGRITALSTTNRVEVMDAAVNLREIRDLLAREQSENSEQRLVEEFILQHARAGEVLEKLHQILGLETPFDRMSEDQLETIQERYQFQAELIKELGDNAPGIKPHDAGVYLIANERKNSILANAAPDKIAVIRQAIRALDVPQPSQERLQLSELTTMKVYQLNGAEADAVAEILEDLRDIGKLHASARFSEDDDRQILFAYASIEDHLTIQSVVKQLAGSARTFRVIPLTNLRASYVAATVRRLMGENEESSGGGDDDWRDRWRRRRNNDNNGWQGFRVEADPPNNRLFLFATDAELQQVEDLLVTIGEGTAGRNPTGEGRLRVVDVSAETADQALDQLRTLWPSVGSNPLKIEVPGHRPSEEVSPLRRRNIDQGNDSDKSTSAIDVRGNFSGPGHVGTRTAAGFDESADRPQSLGFASLVAMQQETGSPGEADPREPSDAAAGFDPLDWESSGARAPRPPITIRQGPDGRLLLSSEDTVALDQMEQLIRQLVPERKPYTVFRVQHASPYTIELTLREIFAIDAVRVTSPLNFVSDEATRSIMVFGAGDRELREIEDLIRFYDQPQPGNPQAVRKPRFFELQHADATAVANVLKEIYRDLLSANDRALARSRDGDERRSSTYVPIADPTEMRPRFQGMLSMGVFPETNSLIVSAPEFLTNEIAATIERLDRPASPTVTRVVSIGGGVNPTLVAQHLTNLMAPREAAAEPREPDRRDREDENDRGRRGDDDRTERGDDAGRRGDGGDVRTYERSRGDRYEVPQRDVGAPAAVFQRPGPGARRRNFDR